VSDDDLKKLPPAPMDDLWAERLRRRAQAALSAERRRPLARAWSRVAVPTLLAAACVVYVVWAVQFTSALYH
jgi:hypothetical protein